MRAGFTLFSCERTDVGYERFQLIGGQLLVESRHLVLSLDEQSEHLGIRHLLNLGRSERFDGELLPHGCVAFSRWTMTDCTFRLVNRGRISSCRSDSRQAHDEQRQQTANHCASLHSSLSFPEW